MSLLQDALHNLQQEQTPSPPTSRARPVPFPLSSPPDAGRMGRRIRALAVALAVAAVAGAVVWAVRTRITVPVSPPVAVGPESTGSAPLLAEPARLEPVAEPAAPAAPRVAPSTDQAPQPARYTVPMATLPIVKPARHPMKPERVSSDPRKIAAAASSAAFSPSPTTAGALTAKPSRSGGRSETLATFNQGSQALAASDWAEAERIFRQLVEDDPRIVEGWNNLGIALLRQGKTSGARIAFSQALLLDPGYAAGLQNMGLFLLEKEGRPAEAVEYFHRAAAANPDGVAPQVNLAVALARIGRAVEAQGVLVAAQKRFPRDPDLLYHLGTVSERIGDRERAAEAYTAFLAITQGNGSERERAVRDRLDAWEKRGF